MSVSPLSPIVPVNSSSQKRATPLISIQKADWLTKVSVILEIWNVVGLESNYPELSLIPLIISYSLSTSVSDILSL